MASNYFSPSSYLQSMMVGSQSMLAVRMTCTSSFYSLSINGLIDNYGRLLLILRGMMYPLC